VALASISFHLLDQMVWDLRVQDRHSRGARGKYAAHERWSTTRVVPEVHLPGLETVLERWDAQCCGAEQFWDPPTFFLVENAATAPAVVFFGHADGRDTRRKA